MGTLLIVFNIILQNKVIEYVITECRRKEAENFTCYVWWG